MAMVKSTNLIEYELLRDRLEATLMVYGEGKETEEIRDLMDPVWLRLNDEEICLEMKMLRRRQNDKR